MKYILYNLKRLLGTIGLLPHVKRLLQRCLKLSDKGKDGSRLSYFIRMAIEQANFADCTEVHDLPEIYHYWSNKYLRPKCELYGFSHIDMFYVLNLKKCLAGENKTVKRFLSIGSGNCDTEIRLARQLLDDGFEKFVIECMDINTDMLDRGTILAIQAGVEKNIIPLREDFNIWTPSHEYDAIIANQSLHHVLELEHLFDSIKAALTVDGRFITSDMIGRNGHQRWPEALRIVQDLWQELPESHRYNHLQKRREKEFIDIEDVQALSFEGIRAQDILPLAVERFHFDFFAAFANIIDPFIDRAFGYNFDISNQWDTNFIDRVHRHDEVEMQAGHIKPTHMLAVMRRHGPGERQFMDGLSPEACIRRPDEKI